MFSQLRSASTISAALLLTLAACAHDDGTTASVTPVATTFAATSGNDQIIVTGAAASAPLAVKLTDQTGASMSGVAVTWSLVSGGGSLDSTATKTDSAGVARTTYTAGLTAGTVAVTASTASLSTVSFAETIIAPPTVDTVSAYVQLGSTIERTGGVYTASAANASAVTVNGGGALTLILPAIVKDVGDASDSTQSALYGVNAGVRAEGASAVTLEGGTVHTAASGSAGVFASGAGSSVTVTATSLTTLGRSSPGAAATYGATVSLADATVSSESSPGVVSAFGGTATITRGSVTTHGDGAPALYSAGTLSVEDASASSSAGSALVVDGAHTATLTNSVLTAARTGVELTSSATSDGGLATVTLSGGTLDAGGDAIRVSAPTGRTQSVIALSRTTVSGASGTFLDVGRSGYVTLTATGALLTGDVNVDATSAAALTLHTSSALRGAIHGASVALDSTSWWAVSGPSAVTSLAGAVIVDDLITNVLGFGYTVTYDASLPENAALAGKTYALANGGVLSPRTH